MAKPRDLVATTEALCSLTEERYLLIGELASIEMLTEICDELKGWLADENGERNLDIEGPGIQAALEFIEQNLPRLSKKVYETASRTNS